MWSVMTDWDWQLNIKGIAAFEAAEATLNQKSLPGFEVDKTLLKDDFKKTSIEKQGGLKANGAEILSKKPLTTHGFSPVMIGSKASTLNFWNPILGTDDKKILPEYSVWSKWLRSSINYEDLGAGKLT